MQTQGEKMTDRELLELAAKAAEIEYEWHYGCGDALHLTAPSATAIYWNPLTDDGDALRLAVKLGICIVSNFDGDRVVADAGEFSQHHVCQMFEGDKFAATRRAIVRAAAEMGEA